MLSPDQAAYRAVPPPFKLLILEDSAADAELEERALRRAGLTFTSQLVATKNDFVNALGQFRPDIVIVDYQIPGFNGFDAAKLAKSESVDRPVILVTGALNDDAAMDLIKAGISDYVLKDRLARLPSAVTAALAEVAEIRARQEVERSRHELARVLECARDGVIGMDVAGIVTAWNGSASRIYGHSASEAVGRPIRDVLGNGYTRLLAHAIRRIEPDEDLATVETNYRGTDAKYSVLSLSLSATHDATGAKSGTSIIVRDITRQKQTQLQLKRTSEELAQSLQQISQTNAMLQHEIEIRSAAELDAADARSQAERANAAKTSYMSHVSHEIRTPMTSIIGFADLLLDSPLSNDQARKVRNLRDAAKSLLSIVNDILDISGVESGRLKLSFAPTNVRTTVEWILTTLRPKANDKALDLRGDVSPDVPSWVRTDPNRLRQILLNLVGNALKFTEFGSVVLSVARDPSPGNELIRFEVIDTGIGIPQDKQADLFSEFYRVRQYRGRDAEGSGLGLAISKRLVGVMNGSIGVKSREGEGSVFWFVLPMSSLAHEPAPVVAAPDSLQHRTGRILVAEDLPMNQMIISEMLERAGHTVMVVGDGMTATTVLRAETFDVVLMDVEMPVMDGLEATREIRRADKARMTPIVALTANAMPPQIDDCLAAGMDDFVSKPIDRVLLLYTLDKWIGRSAPGKHLADQTTTSVPDRNLLDALECQYGPHRARRFLAMARENIARITRHLPDCRDRDAVAHELHDLVSVAGNIGLRDLSEQSRELMCVLRSGVDDVSGLATTVLASAQTALASIDMACPAVAEEALPEIQ